MSGRNCGDELRAAVDLLASADREIDKDSDCGEVFLRLRDFVPDEADESAWWCVRLRDEDDLHSWYALEDGRLVLRGERPWSPPASVVKTLSLRFPGLTWECDYAIEFQHREIVRYRSGEQVVKLREETIADHEAIRLVTIREGRTLDPPVLRITCETGPVDPGSHERSSRLELEIGLRHSLSWDDAGQLLQSATSRVAWGLILLAELEGCDLGQPQTCGRAAPEEAVRLGALAMAGEVASGLRRESSE